jgi:uncharacterized protein
MDILQSALAYAKQQFEHESSGHDFQHTLRVYRMALRLAKTEGADPNTVALAAILHDVDDYKLFGSPLGSTQNAMEFMVNEKCDQTLIDNVIEIIQTLSFKGTSTQSCRTLEGQIVQDADRLDAIGAIGIARAFTFGGNRNRILHDPSIPPNLHMDASAYVNHQGTTLNHFYEKLILLKDQMNTQSAKDIAEHRHQVLIDFLHEFTLEWDAKDAKIAK